MKSSLFAALTISAGLAAVPAMALTNNSSYSGNATTNRGADVAQPSQRNPLLSSNGDVRMSKLIGTNVYNDHDQKLGSVDDVLMGKNGEPNVVMKVNGNLVQVPWNKLEFGNAKQNSDNKVIMPGETQDGLNKQPHVRYQTGSNSGGIWSGGNAYGNGNRTTNNHNG